MRLFCRVMLRRLRRRARLGWLCRFDWVRCSAFVLRWCVYPARCSCGGSAAGAIWGCLCPLAFGLVLGLSLALVAAIRPGVAAAAMPPGRFWVAVPRVVSAALRVGHCVSLDGLALPMRLRRPFILRGARISNHQPRPSSRRSRLPVISRRRACPTARCCGAGCPGYGSRRTGVSCWRDGLGPVSFTDCPARSLSLAWACS